MAEEIFEQCLICKKQFNFEWGGYRVGFNFICSNEKCQKEHDLLKKEEKKEKEK